MKYSILLQHAILDEALYFKNIYKSIPIEKLIEFSINKYIKIKIYNRKFTDIHRNVGEFHRVLMDAYQNHHKQYMKK
jgi:hypothetical protein